MLTVSLFTIPASMVTTGMILADQHYVPISSIFRDRENLSFNIDDQLISFELNQPVKLVHPIKLSTGDTMPNGDVLTPLDILALKTLEDINNNGGVLHDCSNTHDLKCTHWQGLASTALEIHSHLKEKGNPYACLVVTNTSELRPF